MMCLVSPLEDGRTPAVKGPLNCTHCAMKIGRTRDVLTYQVQSRWYGHCTERTAIIGLLGYIQPLLAFEAVPNSCLAGLII